MLAPWMQVSRWKDEAAVYRASPTNVRRFVRVPGLEKIPCRRKSTSNFDQMKSLVGQSNTDNLLTSDELRFPPGFDVRAEDKVLLNGSEWFTVAGDPMEKRIIPRQVAFITLTVPPPIDPDGAWSDAAPTGVYTERYEEKY